MDITVSEKAPIFWKCYLKVNAGLRMWAFSCKYDPSPVTITVNDICLGIVLFMSCCNYPPSLLLSLFLTLSPFALSGIPGKKCGVIIFTAEELSNCRVSVLPEYFHIVCIFCLPWCCFCDHLQSSPPHTQSHLHAGIHGHTQHEIMGQKIDHKI